MQIPCGVHPEIPAQSALQLAAQALGAFSGSWRAEGVRDRGGAPDVDHVHMLLSIPPKYSVSQVLGT